MKKNINLYSFTISILLLYIVSFFILQPFLCLEFSDFFTGLGAIGTVASLLFIYFQVLKTEEQFTKSSKPLLVPLNCHFIAWKKILSIDPDDFVLNKVINNQFVSDDFIEIKCLRNQAVNIKVDIKQQIDTLISRREYLFVDINDVISIQMPDEFLLKLSKIGVLEAGLRNSDEYDDLTKNLNYTISLKYQDMYNNDCFDEYTMLIETRIKIIDGLGYAMAELNFKKNSN